MSSSDQVVADVVELEDASAAFVAVAFEPIGAWTCPGCGEDVRGLDETPIAAMRAHLVAALDRGDGHADVKIVATRNSEVSPK